MSKLGNFNAKNPLVLLGVAGLAYYIWKSTQTGKGLFEQIGSDVMDSAGGIVKGGVDSIGQGMGMPSMSDMTQSASVGRYIIDHPDGGYMAASFWVSAVPYGQALIMTPSQATYPPPGSAVARRFPTNRYQIPGGYVNEGDYWPNDGDIQYDEMGNVITGAAYMPIRVLADTYGAQQSDGPFEQPISLTPETDNVVPIRTTLTPGILPGGSPGPWYPQPTYEI